MYFFLFLFNFLSLTKSTNQQHSTWTDLLNALNITDRIFSLLLVNKHRIDVSRAVIISRDSKRNGWNCERIYTNKKCRQANDVTYLQEQRPSKRNCCGFCFFSFLYFCNFIRLHRKWCAKCFFFFLFYFDFLR